MKWVMRFGKKVKLSLRYIGPFEILECVGPMAYRLVLPSNLSRVHRVFYVFMLKRYHGDGDYIIKWDSVVLGKDLQYEKEPIAILDRDVRKLRTKEIKSVKVQWKHYPVEKATGKLRRTCETSIPNCSSIQVLLHSFFSLFFPKFVTQEQVMGKLLSIVM
ncbi:hypothetical protein MTR67_007644, partial [Solanum verrucosum]